jgi:hypothetical protein
VNASHWQVKVEQGESAIGLRGYPTALLQGRWVNSGISLCQSTDSQPAQIHTAEGFPHITSMLGKFYKDSHNGLFIEDLKYPFYDKPPQCLCLILPPFEKKLFVWYFLEKFYCNLVSLEMLYFTKCYLKHFKQGAIRLE